MHMIARIGATLGAIALSSTLTWVTLRVITLTQQAGHAEQQIRALRKAAIANRMTQKNENQEMRNLIKETRDEIAVRYMVRDGGPPMWALLCREEKTDQS